MNVVAADQTFAVTAVASNREDWIVDGQADPTLTLQRGSTYTFELNNVAESHPFTISGDGMNPYPIGVTNNGASGTTMVTFTVPADAPSTMFYVCTVHPPMIGMLVIADPPAFAFQDGFESP